MSDVELLVKFIELQPDDFTAAAGLTDALMQERDMNRSEADRYVERVVASARDARDLTAAAALVAVGSADRERLIELLLLGTGVDAVERVTVILLPGSRPPIIVPVDHPLPANGYFAGWSMSVGASWLLRYHREHVQRWEPKPKARRRPRPR